MGKIISRTITSPESGEDLKVNFEFNTKDSGFTMSNKVTLDQFMGTFKGLTGELDDVVSSRKEKGHIHELTQDVVEGVLRFKDAFNKEGGADCKTVFYENGKVKCFIEGRKIYEVNDKECIVDFINGVREEYLGGKLIGPGEKRF